MNSNITAPRKQGQSGSLSDKIQVLNTLNSIITQKEAQLNGLYAEREQLEREIAGLRTSRCSIKTIPVELLVETFSKVIDLDPATTCTLATANADRIALMLVCKYWREIIVGTPFLWSTIYICTPNNPDIECRWLSRVDRYIDLCLKRCGVAPLDLVLDFKEGSWGCLFAEQRTFSLLKKFAEIEGLSDWLGAIDWRTCPTAIRYDNLYDGLVGRLLDPESAVKKHLQGLYLELPNFGLPAERFWQRFYSDPEGSEVDKFTALNSSHTSYPPHLIHQVANVLKHLALPTVYLADVPILPNLRVLKIWIFSWEYEWTNLYALEHFPGLQELGLVSQGGFEEDEADSFEPLNFITLPDLRYLLIEEDVPSVIIQAFKVPNLEKLTIKDKYDSLDSIPKAQMFTTTQSIVFSYRFHRSKPCLSRFLSSIFKQLSAVQTIEIEESAAEIAVSRAVYWKDRGELPCLRSVIARSSDGSRRVAYTAPGVTLEGVVGMV